MCMGIPMQVVQCEALEALCEGRGERRQVNLWLVGNQAPGSWVLVHQGSAREVLSAERAQHIDRALDALELSLRGESIEGLFADLENREPTLPDFLRPANSTRS